MQQSIEVDLALITSYDALLRAVELTMLKTARHHDAQSLSLLQTGPGIGNILRLVLLYEIHNSHRFPRRQDFISSCRRVQCAKSSAGKRLGTSGAKSGNAHLKWAFSDAAVLCLSNHPAAQKYLARLENKHGQGKALTLVAQQLARAVYPMLKRQGAVERETFFHPSGRGADAPDASLDNTGRTLKAARETAACLASANARTPLGPHPLRPGPLLGHPRSRLVQAALVAHGQRGLLLPRA